MCYSVKATLNLNYTHKKVLQTPLTPYLPNQVRAQPLEIELQPL